VSTPINTAQLRAIAFALREVASSLGKDADVQVLIDAATFLEQAAEKVPA